MTARARAAAIALALAATTVARPAGAFVHAVNDDTQLPVYWTTPCAVATIYLNGFSQLTRDEVAKSIAAAAQAWSPNVVTCPGTDSDAGGGHPSFEIITQISSGGPIPPVGRDAGADGKNTIVFQTTSWDYDASAIALTSRNTDPSGRIFDADIQIKALGPAIDGYTWANLDPNSPSVRGGSYQIDLQTAITHEFGHFLGLGHTCYQDGVDPPPRPNDDQGRPVPDCTDGASIPEAQAVMWYLVDYDSTAKRVITEDDARGVCALYPPAAAPPVCAANLPDDGCGCRAGGPRPAAAGALLLALAALTTARRRRN